MDKIPAESDSKTTERIKMDSDFRIIILILFVFNCHSLFFKNIIFLSHNEITLKNHMLILLANF